ncbi:PREDICTED: peptidyl-prolyl cis-trans isomerase CYP21-3, mitochondrial [Tarenaya hassleriana]|uniref:peptidyl-prolyl cis-trans isomerase CYP21-3, mitochondrial n=1 Tax=Tarenaya hassleriana TaxID=28532 RepID=UPI00053C82F6|nr:PREDICTED: peptidyl-prolyl cis-trans isomerase CYP21-3, mitochondrial [Tarenaya hassleriana]
MAKIKPQALLQQSKKKKGPARISVANIVISSLVVLLIVFFLFSAYRRWSQRPEIPAAHNGRSVLEESNKDDLPRYATLDTGKGSVTVELFRDGSPDVVDEFMRLCQDGYFKGMLFHRVIKRYVIQVGDSGEEDTASDWTSLGGGKKSHHNLDSSVKHEGFLLGTPIVKNERGGFEIFITTAAIPDMKEKLIVFGRVAKGQDVIQEIEEVETDEHYRPKSPVEIMDVTLHQQI